MGRSQTPVVARTPGFLLLAQPEGSSTSGLVSPQVFYSPANEPQARCTLLHIAFTWHREARQLDFACQ